VRARSGIRTLVGLSLASVGKSSFSRSTAVYGGAVLSAVLRNPGSLSGVCDLLVTRGRGSDSPVKWRRRCRA
jgi:hypothetical protein